MSVFIVDDEQASVETLTAMVSDFYPNITILGCAHSVSNAIDGIRKFKPDTVLLDIELSDGSGFDVVKAFPNPEFKIIFITAFDQFAVQAFRLSAVDYILKPVNPIELKDAIGKAIQHNAREGKQLELLTLLHNLTESTRYDKRIVLKTNDDIHLIKTTDLCRIESDGAYCHFYLESGKRITVSHNIKHYDDLLSAYGFVRCHQSHMVNLRFIDRYQKSDGGMLVLTSGSQIPVSSRKKDSVLSSIQHQGIN